MAAVFSGSNGESKLLIRDEILDRAGSPKSADLPIHLWSDRLRNCMFTEADRYLDRALYSICSAKNLVEDFKLTWAAVTFYYASFFAVSGLVRLQVESVTRIEKVPYRVVVDDLTDDTYALKKSRGRGSHEPVWGMFHRLYSTFNWRPGEFDMILRSVQTGDMTLRHAKNYDLGEGYSETLQPRRVVTRDRNRLYRNVLDDAQAALRVDDTAMEVRALRRVRLLLELLVFIESTSPFRSFFEARQARRRQFVSDNLRHDGLRSTILTWIT